MAKNRKLRNYNNNTVIRSQSSQVEIDDDLIKASIRAGAAGVSVNNDNAYSIPPFRAIVDGVSSSIAFCGINVIKPTKTGDVIDRKHIAHSLLNHKANNWLPSYYAIRNIVADAIGQGNGYLLISRDANLMAESLILLDPESVYPILDTANGEIWYRVVNSLGNEAFFHSDDVLHLRSVSSGRQCHWNNPLPYGFMGRNVIDDLRETLGISIASTRYSAAWYKHSGGGMLVITYPAGTREPSPEEKAEIRQKMEAIHSGATNAHRLLQLFGGASAARVGPSNSEGQVLEARQFSIIDICNGLGCQSFSKFGSQVNQSYASQEWESKAYLNDLNKFIVPLEEEFTAKLLSDAEIRAGVRIELNRDDLIEIDANTKSQIAINEVNNGLISWEEYRRSVKRSPIKTDGEEWRRPANIVTSLDPPQISPAIAPETQGTEAKDTENSVIEAPKATETAENSDIQRSNEAAKNVVRSAVKRLKTRLINDKSGYIERHRGVFLDALPGAERAIDQLFKSIQTELDNVLPEQRAAVIESINEDTFLGEVCVDLQIQ